MSDLINISQPQAFQFDTWQVRVLNRDGDPWFVLKDVCEALGIANPSMVADRLEEDEKMTLSLAEGHSGQRGGAQSVRIISESGLYSVILRSDKPEAKAFRKWITSEVLPSIRKHGVYATPETIDKIIADPDFGIRLLSTLKEERSARIAAQAELVIAAPKVAGFDRFLDASGTLCISDAAKALGLKPGFLFDQLDGRGLIFKRGGDWLPTQYFLDKGYFEVKTRTYGDPPNEHITKQTRVTPKGLDGLAKLFPVSGQVSA